VELGGAGDGRGQVMQGVESHPGALQTLCHAGPGALQAFGERRADYARIENNRVLAHIRERPPSSDALSVLCEPVGRAPRHTEGARSVLASVELGEDRAPFRRVQAVVAQYVTLARVIADSGDGVPAGPGLIRCSITSRLGARQHLMHLPRTR